MKIFVEGTPLLFRQLTGVGQYTKNLTQALLRIDQKNQYTIFGFLFVGKKFNEQPIEPFPNVRYKLIRFLPSKVFNAVVRKLIAPPIDVLLGSKPDLFIFPNFVRYPLAFGEKSIVVVYDLSYITQPEHAAKRNREYLTRYVPISVRKAQHVITISENSKREIIEQYGVDDKKITIITPAVEPATFFPRPKAEIDQIKQKYHITNPYILYAGTLEPRKNVNGVLDAYEALGEGLRKSYTLVLAGGKGWLDKKIQKRLDDLKDLDIITTGYAPDEDLPALFSGASVFVYPSFYEGFGMPPLEAMACGVPVITANNSSLPEVVGEAGITIDAKDITALATEITRVLNDEELARRMREKGIMQAKKFSWERGAQTLLDIINTVGSDS